MLHESHAYKKTSTSWWTGFSFTSYSIQQGTPTLLYICDAQRDLLKMIHGSEQNFSTVVIQNHFHLTSLDNNATDLKSQWPWLLTFDHQTVISSSSSPSGRLEVDMSLKKPFACKVKITFNLQKVGLSVFGCKCKMWIYFLISYF